MEFLEGGSSIPNKGSGDASRAGKKKKKRPVYVFFRNKIATAPGFLASTIFISFTSTTSTRVRFGRHQMIFTPPVGEIQTNTYGNSLPADGIRLGKRLERVSCRKGHEHGMGWASRVRQQAERGNSRLPIIIVISRRSLRVLYVEHVDRRGLYQFFLSSVLDFCVPESAAGDAHVFFVRRMYVD